MKTTPTAANIHEAFSGTRTVYDPPMTKSSREWTDKFGSTNRSGGLTHQYMVC